MTTISPGNGTLKRARASFKELRGFGMVFVALGLLIGGYLIIPGSRMWNGPLLSGLAS